MSTGLKTYKNASQKREQDRLILEHLEYVRQLLGKMLGGLPAGVDIENLEAAGTLGLIESARKFDPARGVTFKTFAYNRIRGAIFDELRRNCPLSQQKMQQISAVQRACESLQPPVTPEAIAKESGLSVSTVEECLEAVRLTQPEPWNDLKCMVHDRWNPSVHQTPEAEAERNEVKEILAEGIEELPERERLVVTLYYLEDLRYKEIGKVLNLSESRVSRLLTRAEFRLRELVRHRMPETS
jgi:RNA polymerase sigma factor for flagellar operon FliA